MTNRIVPCINFATCGSLKEGTADVFCANCGPTYVNYALYLASDEVTCDMCHSANRYHVTLLTNRMCIDCYTLMTVEPPSKQFPDKHPLGVDHQNACANKCGWVEHTFVDGMCRICTMHNKAEDDFYEAEMRRTEHMVAVQAVFGANKGIVSAPHDKYLAFLQSTALTTFSASRTIGVIRDPTDIKAYPAECIEVLTQESMQWKMCDGVVSVGTIGESIRLV